ncbi:MAG: hypothetical protein PWQ91_225 [Eubacteriales bacterium]|nr:hypothetical protein [Eubacteriales bacterium]
MKKCEPARLLDVTGDKCPITYVKVRLALEEMEPGRVLKVLLKDGDTLRNVCRSLAEDGQMVLAVEKEGNFAAVYVEKKG